MASKENLSDNIQSGWKSEFPSLEEFGKRIKTHLKTEGQKWTANLQPTLNNGGGDASLTNFVTDCREIPPGKFPPIKLRPWKILTWNIRTYFIVFLHHVFT